MKAVALGDSITVYPHESFVLFLQAACPRLAVVNLAQPRLGAEAIRAQFRQQVLRNPRLHVHDAQEVWLIYSGWPP